MLILRQSTSIDIRMGPFVDATNGVTPETTVTLAGADQAEVLKANGANTVTMAGTFSGVTGCAGWYDYTCAAGDVDTVGEVVFVVQDESLCLPVFTRGYVVEEAIYDALYVGSADGFDASGQVTVGSMAANTVTSTSMATDCIGSDQLAATAVTDIWAKVCESQGSYTAQQIMSIMLSALAGVTSSGGATLETPNGAANRIVATVNGSNERTAMTLTPSS